MYDPITTAYLFFLLVPGVLLYLPPGVSVMIAAAVHAIVFYIVNQYGSTYVPWWGIWAIGVTAVTAKVYFGM